MEGAEKEGERKREKKKGEMIHKLNKAPANSASGVTRLTRPLPKTADGVSPLSPSKAERTLVVPAQCAGKAAGATSAEAKWATILTLTPKSETMKASNP